jgi:hypothetical protein
MVSKYLPALVTLVAVTEMDKNTSLRQAAATMDSPFAMALPGAIPTWFSAPAAFSLVPRSVHCTSFMVRRAKRPPFIVHQPDFTSAACSAPVLRTSPLAVLVLC